MSPRQKVVTKYRRYYERNKARLREQSRVRMAQLRAARRNSEEAESSDTGHSSGRDTVVVTAFSGGDMVGFTSASSDDGSCSSDWSDGSDYLTGWGSTDESDSGGSLSLRTYPADPAIEDDANHLASKRHIDYLQETGRQIHAWLAEWGGLESWEDYLDTQYYMSQAAGDTDQFVRRVLDHAARGRLYAQMLGQMEAYIPSEMWKIREMWRQQTILVSQVAEALSIIKVRVNVVRAGPFNLVSDYMPPVD